MSDFRIIDTEDGTFIQKYDTYYDKWRVAGQIITVDEEKGYYSKHRDIRRTHNALGISEDIVNYLLTESVVHVIKRVGTKKRGFFTFWRGTVDYFATQSIRDQVKNDSSDMLYVPLRELIYLGRNESGLLML